MTGGLESRLFVGAVVLSQGDLVQLPHPRKEHSMTPLGVAIDRPDARSLGAAPPKYLG